VNRNKPFTLPVDEILLPEWIEYVGGLKLPFRGRPLTVRLWQVGGRNFLRMIRINSGDDMREFNCRCRAKVTLKKLVEKFLVIRLGENGFLIDIMAITTTLFTI